MKIARKGVTCPSTKMAQRATQNVSEEEKYRIWTQVQKTDGKENCPITRIKREYQMQTLNIETD
jgi:hypothetical protein